MSGHLAGHESGGYRDLGALGAQHRGGSGHVGTRLAGRPEDLRHQATIIPKLPCVEQLPRMDAWALVEAAAQLRDQRPVLGARVVRHVVPAVRRVADDEVRVEHGRVGELGAVAAAEQAEQMAEAAFEAAVAALVPTRALRVGMTAMAQTAKVVMTMAVRRMAARSARLCHMGSKRLALAFLHHKHWCCRASLFVPRAATRAQNARVY